MKTIVLAFGILLSTVSGKTGEILLSIVSDKTEQIQVDLSDFERDARALELYLQDQKDHETYCSQIEWDQPPLSVYKDTLSSHLPEGCKL